MNPFRGLTTWAAFQNGKRAQTMVMGDIVLFQDEVNRAMSAALDNGLVARLRLRRYVLPTRGYLASTNSRTWEIVKAP